MSLSNLEEAVSKINALVNNIDEYMNKEESSLKQGLVNALIDLGCDVSIDNSLGELFVALENVKTIKGVTATSSDIITGKIIQNDEGEYIPGEIPVNSTENITKTPTRTDINLPAGYYGGNIVISGNSNLIASNIKKGVNIFGVTGSTYASI